MRLRNGLAALAAFQAAVTRLNPNGSGVEDLNRPAAAITSAIHPQAVGWRVLAALGLSPRQLVAVSMLRTLAVAAGGAPERGSAPWPG